MRRILWCSHRDILNPLAGGAERTTFEIGRRLVGAGYQFTIVAPVWPGAPAKDRIDGVEIIRLGKYFGPHLARLWMLYPRPKVDFVIDDLAHVVPWEGFLANSSHGAAFFRHFHGRTIRWQARWPASELLGRLERSYERVYRKWPFVTESEAGRADLEHLGIARDRVHLIPPGVDLSLYHPTPKSRRPSVVYFAGLKRYKRPDVAVRVFGNVLSTHPDATLYIVGEGTERSSLVTLSAQLGLTSKVCFVGRLSLRDLASLVSSSWVNVHTSVAEGWGLSALEAAAAGTPTVAFRVPGISESVSQGGSGLLVADGDLAGLSNALSATLDRHEEWTDSSRKWAERFPWGLCATRWSDFIENCIRGST